MVVLGFCGLEFLKHAGGSLWVEGSVLGCHATRFRFKGLGALVVRGLFLRFRGIEGVKTGTAAEVFSGRKFSPKP